MPYDPYMIKMKKTLEELKATKAALMKKGIIQQADIDAEMVKEE